MAQAPDCHEAIWLSWVGQDVVDALEPDPTSFDHECVSIRRVNPADEPAQVGGLSSLLGQLQSR